MKRSGRTVTLLPDRSGIAKIETCIYRVLICILNTYRLTEDHAA